MHCFSRKPMVKQDSKKPHSPPSLVAEMLPKAHYADTLSGHTLSRIAIHAKEKPGIQPKLAINKPGDRYEQEADRVAEWVVSSQSRTTDQATGISPTTHKTTRPDAHNQIPGAQLVERVLDQAGRPLDDSTRRQLEPHFGFDFSQVRTHTDAQAAKAASEINAHAFTFGNHIAFAASQYAPTTNKGRTLLAHELTHVVQQGRAGGEATIQREAASPEQGGQDPLVRRQYISLVCEVVADIQRGVAQGQTWYFEDQGRLQADDQAAPSPLIHSRIEALQGLIRELEGISQEIFSGAIIPSQPASRTALRAIWRSRHPQEVWYPDTDSPPPGHPANWSNPTGIFHEPDRPRRVFQSLGGYIDNQPDSPAGILQPARLTGGMPACQAPQPSSRNQWVTPDELGHNTVIFISRLGGTVTGWDWEPRNATHIVASRPFGPHEWHYDQGSRRVYIIVDGQRYNLLRYGRIERQP